MAAERWAHPWKTRLQVSSRRVAMDPFPRSERFALQERLRWIYLSPLLKREARVARHGVERSHG
jgi:hypothetical protein